MPKEQTVKSRFKSDFGGGYISASQWIAEFMCRRKSQKDKKDLVFKFWEQEDWKKFFQFQVVIAARYLKKYHPLAIAEAIRSVKSCYSINAPFLLPIIEKMQLKYKNRILEYDTIEHEYNPITQHEIIVEKPRDSFIAKESLASKLD